MMDRRLLLVALTLGTSIAGCGINTSGTGAYAEAPEFDGGFGGQAGNQLDGSKADANTQTDTGKADTSVDSSVVDSSIDQSVDQIADTLVDTLPDSVLEDVESGVGCWTGQKLCGVCIADNNPQTGCAESKCTPCTFAHAQPTCANGMCAILKCDTGWANCDGDSKNGCETDVTTSVGNCGACGHGCNLPNASSKCVLGSCQIDKCSAHYGDCEQAQPGCETALTSIDNCEQCGKKCQVTGGTPTCATGKCELDHCNAPQQDCNKDGVCEVNLQTDSNNCGFCGNVCTRANASATCENGLCKVLKCTTGFEDCNKLDVDGCEINLLSSLDNCGSCGGKCDPTNGTSPSCGNGKCSYTCTTGWGDCNGPQPGAIDDGCEVNTNTTLTSCGACGRSCNGGHVAVGSCAAGKCVSSCQAGWGNCNQPSAPNSDDGCEVDLNTAQNCGGCGRGCAATNVQAASCAAGVCTSSCKAGFSNCSRPTFPLGDDGCETATASDVNNCGSCGRACAANGVDKTTCTGGLCTSTCTSGLGNCKQPPSPAVDDGCETDLTTSADNCGGCGAACKLTNASSRTCSGSLCAPVCQVGYANCNGQKPPATDDGCEINTTSNASNCGSCGGVCSSVGGTPWCSVSKCGISCGPGFGDCNTSASDGCETPTTSDLNNCGACGKVCSTINGGASCVTSGCQIACFPGYLDCNKTVAAPGCEVDGMTDKNNCGACGKICNGTNGAADCNNSVCSIACTAGFGDCNNDPSDGCEVPFTTASNCGACGIKCTNANGTTACVAATCQPTCFPGWANCDGDLKNGCEASITVETSCGACGRVCSRAHVPVGATITCSALGECNPSMCDSGWSNVTAKAPIDDGCETAVVVDAGAD